MNGIEGNNSPALKAIHNIHLGERCFIIGTGPSLIESEHLYPPWVLKNEHTIGVNYISRIPGWGEIVDHVVCFELDQLHDIDNAVKIRNKSRKIPPTCWYSYFQDNNQPLNSEWNYIPRSLDSTIGSWIQPIISSGTMVLPMTGPTLFCIAVPLAVWMGFKSIFLLGCENTPTGYAYDLDADRANLTINGDVLNRAAEVAKDDLALAGIKLVDLTPNGNLPLIRGDLSAALAGRL